MLSDDAALAAASAAPSVSRRDRLVREAERKRLARAARQPVRLAPARSAMEVVSRAPARGAMEVGHAMEVDARAMEAERDALAADFARWAELAYARGLDDDARRERGRLNARLHAAGAFKK